MTDSSALQSRASDDPNVEHDTQRNSSPSNGSSDRKLEMIIEREFDKEIQMKEEEVTLANGRILQLLRNIDILKYVATYSYFDKPSADPQQTAQQTRIHPAVKKLLTTVHWGNIEKKAEECIKIETPENEEITSSNLLWHDKQETINDLVSNEPINIDLTQDSVICRSVQNSEQNSDNKVVYRSLQKLIIGNTSRWLPPDTREDGATHKWMVYVRDEKDNISSYMSSVRFYLHDSYSPNNIVDVIRPPFVLSRRGWGEFTIKVRLHFVHSLNKPVDVFHKIKLDQTLSGVQTLGSETVVALNLYKLSTENCYLVDTDSDSDDESAEMSFIQKIIELEHDYI